MSLAGNYYICDVFRNPELSLTLMVSNGCPDATRHMPPNPPAKKSFIADFLGSPILNFFEKDFLNNQKIVANKIVTFL